MRVLSAVRAARVAVIAGLATLALSQPTQAAQIVTNVMSWLTPDRSYTGEFDLSSYLHTPSGAFEVAGATLTLSGFSTPNIIRTETPWTPAYLTGISGGRQIYESFQYVYYTDDVADQMVLTTSSVLGEDVVGHSHDGYREQLADEYPNAYSVLKKTRINISDIDAGELNIYAVLQTEDLKTINTTGKLRWTASAPVGTYLLGSGVLDFYVRPVSESAVPEPAAWALMILGFGAVGGTLRRRTTLAYRSS
jgi:hypothetical protein